MLQDGPLVTSTIAPQEDELVVEPRTFEPAVTSNRVPGGVVHELPMDLRDALLANSTLLHEACLVPTRIA